MDKIKPISAYFILFLMALCLFLCISTPAYAQTGFSRAAQFLFEIAKEYYDQGDYPSALHEFKKVLLIEPEHKGAREYIEFIEEIKAEEEITFREEVMERAIEWLEKVGLPEEEAPVVEKKRREAIFSVLDKEEKRIAEELKEVTYPVPRKPKRKGKIKKIKAEEIKTLYLNDELWATQPKTTIEIELDKSLIMEATTIGRYLVEKPEKLEIERIDTDRVKITGKNIGSTFLHIWDDQGRWTVNVGVIHPYILLPKEEEMFILEEEPFRFSYSANRQSYHRRDPGEDLTRRSLSFNQWAQIAGPTPYGDFDTSVTARKFDEEYEVTSYTVGLTDGKLGKLKNFNLRGFDFYTSFSDLSYPGELLRGVFWESDAFNENIHYTVFRGQERQAFGLLPPGVEEEKKAYIEGASLSLFSPEKNKTFSFNYARGSGSDREDFLKNQVYSFDGEYKFEDIDFRWEIAYDGYFLAGVLNSDFQFPSFDLGLDFRN
ncbi:MAG: pilus assembly protein N-terminal domain-containing protein, partial [Omnitrophica bacterium]|nr:pilus assembly protein N-terminal domain-containing protein [Candidatus Omnitrophota bacterium]